EAFVLRSSVIDRSRRVTKKSGKSDLNTPWAKARMAQCKQFKRQIELGLLPQDCLEVLNSIAAGLPPLWVHAIVWWDENHKKVILGHTSKYENRIAKNPFDKEPTPVQFGGVLAAKSMRTAIKFPGEARMCMGAAMVKGEDGAMRGEKAEPFEYSTQWVVGVKAYEAVKEAEMARVVKLPVHPYDYKVKYPDTWEKVVEGVVGRGKDRKVCITALMAHVIDESERIYAGTPQADTFSIFHDGLSAWWEKEAQEYMQMRGYAHRQLRCIGLVNKGTRYAGRMVGDSPEICRALDAHGFADHKLSMAYHTSLSSIYAEDDPRRFGMGTPTAVSSTMRRCWKMEPTSERIVEDIEQFAHVLDVIIEHQGCV
ncbi:hypothetical protein B484DRAFT_461950, partial [Ochromonadaceae sp. CCMP2298]